MDTIVTEKRCNLCHEAKSLDEFNMDKRAPDGHAYVCRECARARFGEWRNANVDRERERIGRWHDEHREHDRAYSREYERRLVAEHPEKKREKDARYRERHKEDIARGRREYGRTHREEARARSRAHYYEHPPDKETKRRRLQDWRKSNPEKSSAYYENRRARILAVGGKISGEEWKDVLSKYGNKCLCCGKTGSLTMDHVVPLDPGPHAIDNIQPLCQSCNSRKGRKAIDYRPRTENDN